MHDGPITAGGHFLLDGRDHMVVTKVVTSPTTGAVRVWVRYADNHVFAYPDVRETWYYEDEFRSRFTVKAGHE